MYTSSDGKKHQANYNIEYDMVEGKITDSFNNTDGGAGYVSHSFNQFIRIENNKIVSVDHGDAYPRSIVIHKYKTDVTTGKFIQYASYPTAIDVLPINEGSIGDNYTGVCVGGFEISDTNYLVAGNIVVDSSKYNDSNAARNV